MMAVNDIMRGVVGRVSERSGHNVSFLFGDWNYIADQLTVWSNSAATACFKFPLVCLYSPYSEEREKKDRELTVDLGIFVNTLKEYTNEQREATSFVQVLRPVYELFMEELNNDPYIFSSYTGFHKHTYTENYRYGRKGVDDGEGKPFRDFIDAIEITNLSLTIKEICDNGNKMERVSRGKHIQHG